MHPSVVSQRYTPEDLLAMLDGHRFDLVDGHLVERNMGAESSWIAQQINRYLGNYAETSQHGLVLGPDCGYQIFSDDPNRVRFPDGSFIRSERLPDDALPRGHIRVVPDLVLEVVSPNDLAWEVDMKVTEYLQAGVPLVWVSIQIRVRSASTAPVGRWPASAWVKRSVTQRCCLASRA